MKFQVKTLYERLNNEIRYGDIAHSGNTLMNKVELKYLHDQFQLSKMRQDHIARHDDLIQYVKMDLNEKTR